MIKFLHISDLHFHKNAAKNTAALATLKSIEEKYPDHTVLVTGDITDDGHALQYANAQSALMPFKDRIYLVPGNHDLGAMGNFYSIERARRFDAVLMDGFNQNGHFTGVNKPVVNIVESGNSKVMLIALDSNLETETPFDFACGEIGAAQLAALDTILSDRSTADFTKFVLFHHHPFVHNNPFMELKDAGFLWRTIYGRIDGMLFGHKHESKAWQNCGSVPHVLASDNSPGKSFAREITVDGKLHTVTDVPI